MLPLHVLMLVVLLGCATGALFMALLRRRAIEQVRREFEQELHDQMRNTETRLARQPGGSRPRSYDA